MSRRIRTIKPEITESESLARCSIGARLCFVYLITNADDEGRMRGTSRMLAHILFPYDDDVQDQFESWLVELESEDCIRRYVVDGSQYLDVVNWSKHQKIDKPKASKFPSFPGKKRRGRVGDVSATHRGAVVDTSETSPRSVAPTSGEDLDLDLDRDHVPGIPPSPPEGGMREVEEGRPGKKRKDDYYRQPYSADFNRFMQAYPPRASAHDEPKAWRAFQIAIENGADVEVLISAAGKYTDEQRAVSQLGSDYVKAPTTWLNKLCWDNYELAPKARAA